MNRLVEHTTTTLAERIDDVAVALLPTGAVEQHGPALPLGTDLLAVGTSLLYAIREKLVREELLPPEHR